MLQGRNIFGAGKDPVAKAATLGYLLRLITNMFMEIAVCKEHLHI
jgi:hypothetical protein